tara:strand:- start:11 stop:193 length:183 start_codon:yes stop_codon:yes gene_type:complete
MIYLNSTYIGDNMSGQTPGKKTDKRSSYSSDEEEVKKPVTRKPAAKKPAPKKRKTQKPKK